MAYSVDGVVLVEVVVVDGGGLVGERGSPSPSEPDEQEDEDINESSPSEPPPSSAAEHEPPPLPVARPPTMTLPAGEDGVKTEQT
jgi:hypothetical protein